MHRPCSRLPLCLAEHDAQSCEHLHQWGIENDVSVNVHTIVRRVLQGIMEVLNKDDDRYPKYHKWVQSGHCPKCDAWMCSPTGHCFECETELTYE